MRRNNQKLIILMLACFWLAGCEETPPTQATQEPATLENVAGSDFHKVILTAEAAKRIDIQLVPVVAVQWQGKEHKSLPYSAILYGLNGETWVYINPEPLTFMRTAITVDAIEGDQVIFSDGPASGSKIVSVGASELYGAENLESIES